MAKKKSRLMIQAFSLSQANKSENAYPKKVPALKAVKQQKHAYKNPIPSKKIELSSASAPSKKISQSNTTIESACSSSRDENGLTRVHNVPITPKFFDAVTDHHQCIDGADHEELLQRSDDPDQVPDKNTISTDETSTRSVHLSSSSQGKSLPEAETSWRVKPCSISCRTAAQNRPLSKQPVQQAPNLCNHGGLSFPIQDAAPEPSPGLQTETVARLGAQGMEDPALLMSLSKRPASNRDLEEEDKDSGSAERRSGRSQCMVGPHDRVLLIGEGNFSFAASLVIYHSHPGHLLTATTNDSETTVFQKYSDAGDHIQKLRVHNVNILFNLDACNLHRDKRLKKHQFDRVVFNFPHTGSRESNMARNIKSNQILILRFLRSVSHILSRVGAHDHSSTKISSHNSSLNKRNKKRKKGATKKSVSSGSEESDREGHNSVSSTHHKANVSHDDLMVQRNQSETRPSKRPGTVLLTLRTCAPYTHWDVPNLAKRGPTLAHTILYPTYPSLNHPNTPQPTYKVTRSSGFHPTDYPGYEHRRTNGFLPGKSTHDSLDVLLPARARYSEVDLPLVSDEEMVARTWELELV